MRSVRLVLDRFTAGFGFAMHDQVTKLVCDVEPLAVVVPLNGIEHDGRPVRGSE